MDVRRNQRGAHGHAAQARLRFANVVESDDESISHCHPERRHELRFAKFGGVEGSLLPSTLPGVGVLRLRSDFAKRSQYSAQDDNSQISRITGMISGRFCVCLEM